MNRTLLVLVHVLLLALVGGTLLGGLHGKPLPIYAASVPPPLSGQAATGALAPQEPPVALPMATATPQPVGSAFTYQGRLTASGSPANGLYDLTFTLYDASAGGSQIGSPLSVLSQTVTDGLFTVSLNFGGSAFQGSARYMALAVRPAGGGSYTTLSPRQPLTPAPYALSLMPGAVISSTLSTPMLSVTNTAGTALSGYASVGGFSGVYGVNNANGGWGVYGASTAGYGVYGQSGSGSAIYGQATSGTGGFFTSQSGIAVEGVISATNMAVYGLNTGNSGGAGVYGQSAGGWGVYGTTTGSQNGVYGSNTGNSGGAGVRGDSTSGAGVYGQGSSYGGWFRAAGTGNSGTGVEGDGSGYGPGVQGYGDSGYGVQGQSTSSDGVYGLGVAAGKSGVRGETSSPAGFGVLGLNNGGPGGAGVAGQGYQYGGTFTATNGIGVYGSGTVDGVIGSGSAGSDGVYGVSSGGYAMHAGGFAKQDRYAGGWVKAMAREGFGGITRCYNSQGAAPNTTAPCGFSISGSNGSYTIDFGFEVDDRFVSVTPEYGNGGAVIPIVDFPSPNQVRVRTYSGGTTFVDSAFFIVIY